VKITIYGCGYVGLVSAACFAHLGHDVLAMDIDEKKIAALKRGESPIHEAGLSELLLADNLHYTSDIREAVEFSPIQIICVGTPESETGAADLTYVDACADAINKHASSEKILVIKSTVPVGTGDALASRLKNCILVSNPEFLREGLAVYDFLHPERVLIGTDHPNAGQTIAALYEKITDERHPIVHMDRRSSELSKYAANAMLATRISFMNEMAQISERVGANIDQVALSMGLDSRIGPLFLRAGCGYGGSCFPKDVAALRHLAASHDYEAEILTAVDSVNAEQKLALVKKVIARFGEDLTGRTFAVWGLAFKPDTDDIREASSLVIIQELLSRNATIQAFDPIAVPNTQKELGHLDRLYFPSDPYACLENADALLLVTEWKEFKNADKDRIENTLKTPVIFDGRNCFHATDWVNAEYFSIGRGSDRPHPSKSQGTRLKTHNLEPA